MNSWRIAAGRKGRFIKEFIDGGFVSIGWHPLGDLTAYRTREEMLDRARIEYPSWTQRKLEVAVNQAWRFVHGIQIGDHIACYDPSERIYNLGRIKGDAEYESGPREEELEVKRSVEWQRIVSRDRLSAPTRNSLGAIQTLIRIPEHAAAELFGVVPAVQVEFVDPLPTEDAVDESDPYAELLEKSVQRVQDILLGLDPYEMQDLIAALLRALGYRTLISPAGADRGKDIVASRDGFGFERPRIVVEVKHRGGRISAPDIRSFIGGRHADDRCLYVSTGGFSQEARYEAERANTVTHLMDLDGLARAVIEQYDNFDDEGRALVPLRKLYWPSLDQ
ncbi:MAG: restriction endonuclease [Sphingopyxis solisilvae]|uniref:restriction endonuclease n=1 Tax=Sphingopyxis solisilvae TaxID=1886788 RepID=UPI0040354CFB